MQGCKTTQLSWRTEALCFLGRHRKPLLSCCGFLYVNVRTVRPRGNEQDRISRCPVLNKCCHRTLAAYVPLYYCTEGESHKCLHIDRSIKLRPAGELSVREHSPSSRSTTYTVNSSWVTDGVNERGIKLRREPAVGFKAISSEVPPSLGFSPSTLEKA